MPIRIHAREGHDTTVYANQMLSDFAGQWWYLGSYDMVSGEAFSEVVADSSRIYISADAFKFIEVEPPTVVAGNGPDGQRVPRIGWNVLSERGSTTSRPLLTLTGRRVKPEAARALMPLVGQGALIMPMQTPGIVFEGHVVGTPAGGR